jgi:hypothetical protein
LLINGRGGRALVIKLGRTTRAVLSPYYEALESVELPPKRFKGDPANLERVHAIMKVMRSGSVENGNTPRERRR